METFRSELWKQKDNDRKDLTYSPLCKNLKDVVHFPVDSDPELCDRVLETYLNNLDE